MKLNSHVLSSENAPSDSHLLILNRAIKLLCHGSYLKLEFSRLNFPLKSNSLWCCLGSLLCPKDAMSGEKTSPLYFPFCLILFFFEFSFFFNTSTHPLNTVSVNKCTVTLGIDGRNFLCVIGKTSTLTIDPIPLHGCIFHFPSPLLFYSHGPSVTSTWKRAKTFTSWSAPR